MFVDGCFWHGCPEHQVIPQIQPRLLGAEARAGTSTGTAGSTRRWLGEGWQVVRVWEHEDKEAAAERIAVTVRQHGRAVAWVSGITTRAAPGTHVDGATRGTGDPVHRHHPAR